MPDQPQISLERPGSFAHTTGPEPSPGPDEALVRVHRVGICGTDLHAFTGQQPFFIYPRILGHELGVEIVSLPDDAPSDLQIGDRCAIEPYLNNPESQASRAGKTNCCEDLQVLGIHTDGGMRPLLTVPATKLHRSESLDHDHLALVEMLCIGAHAVERAQPVENEFVAIVGAGPIGLSTLQFARTFTENIVIIDVSTPRLEFASRMFDVTHAVNPANENIEARLREIGDGDLPTLLLDATGNPRSMMGAFDLVANGGRIVFIGLFQGDVTFNDPNFHRKELSLRSSRNATSADFTRVIASIEDGTIDTAPWITHRIPLDDVPEKFPRVAKNPELLKAIVEI